MTALIPPADAPTTMTSRTIFCGLIQTVIDLDWGANRIRLGMLMGYSPMLWCNIRTGNASETEDVSWRAPLRHFSAPAWQLR